jgi:hypothetical protein
MLPYFLILWGCDGQGGILSDAFVQCMLQKVGRADGIFSKTVPATIYNIGRDRVDKG